MVAMVVVILVDGLVARRRVAQKGGHVVGFRGGCHLAFLRRQLHGFEGKPGRQIDRQPDEGFREIYLDRCPPEGSQTESDAKGDGHPALLRVRGIVPELYRARIDGDLHPGGFAIDGKVCLVEDTAGGDIDEVLLGERLVRKERPSLFTILIVYVVVGHILIDIGAQRII